MAVVRGFNWTLANTFLEFFTSAASPEGECSHLVSTSEKLL